VDVWVVLAVIAGGVTFVSLVLFATAAVATRPREPDPEPAGLELGGTESPAVAGFLCAGWCVPRETVGATAIDLVARGVLAIAEPTDNHYTLAVAAAPADLADHERQVLDLVDRRQTAGPVPVEALSLGDEKEERRWWSRFEKAVRRDARQRGLSRPRWPVPVVVLFVVGGLIPSGLLFLASASRDADAKAEASAAGASTSSDDSDGVATALLLGALVAWVPLVGSVVKSRQERETAEGSSAAARWLGLRENLDANGTFPDLEPVAVAVWDRYLAYAVAFGLAARTAHSLPFAADSPTEAWSCVTGKWRLVHVRYRRSPFGAIRSPLRTMWRGFLAVAATAAVAYYASQFASDVRDSIEEADASWLRWYDLGAIALGVVAGLVVTRGLAMLIVGAADSRKHVIVEGEVLRIRRTSSSKNRPAATAFAIDDGSASVIDAWIVPGSAPDIIRGSTVRVDLAPRLRFVRTYTVVTSLLVSN